MWLLFEGLDKTGKTTLEWEILKRTNYKHTVIDRGPAGYITFDKIFGRVESNSISTFVKQARKFTKDKNCVIYCYCSEEKALARIKANNESCPYNYKKAHRLYLANVKRFYDKNKVIMIDTTDKSIEECAQLIINKIEEVKKMSK